MQRLLIVIFSVIVLGNSSIIFAQSPLGKQIGFGIIVGDPTGVTVKIWRSRENAFVIDAGSSYFGSPRINVDYLWHFDAFHSTIAKLYAGPGGVIGFGAGHGFWYVDGSGFYYRKTGIGLAARGIFGVNFIPKNDPLEIFFETGVLVGLAPDFGSAVDAALGIRYYP